MLDTIFYEDVYKSNVYKTYRN